MKTLFENFRDLIILRKKKRSYYFRSCRDTLRNPDVGCVKNKTRMFNNIKICHKAIRFCIPLDDISSAKRVYILTLKLIIKTRAHGGRVDKRANT